MLQRFPLLTHRIAPGTVPDDGAADAASPVEPASATERLDALKDVQSIEDLQEAGSVLVDVLQSYAVTYVPRLVFAVLALVVGLLVVRILVGLVGRGFKIRNVEKSVSVFVQSVLRVGLKIVVIIMALGILGVPTASLGFIIGAASLAIGFALKDTLQNFAGGVIILLLKPYKIGDYIEAKGFSGSVQEIQIFNTVMTTSDNRRVIIPNGQLSTSALINYSVEATRRIDLTIGVGYTDDIDHARSVIKRIIDADSRTLQEPAPMIKVGDLADSSVNIMIRVWVERGDYLAYRLEFLEKVKLAFDAEGISIPYPQSEITVRQVSG